MTWIIVCFRGLMEISTLSAQCMSFCSFLVWISPSTKQILYWFLIILFRCFYTQILTFTLAWLMMLLSANFLVRWCKDHLAQNCMLQPLTRGATVTGCTPVVSLCCKGLYLYDKQNQNARKNTERLKFQDFNICPNILHADTDADPDANTDAGGIAIALLH